MKRTIKGIRNDLNLTQIEMANKLGISDVTYRNKENYKIDLSAKELIKLSQMVNVDPREIMLKE